MQVSLNANIFRSIKKYIKIVSVAALVEKKFERPRAQNSWL